jgi:hypothetical protein
VSGCVGRTREGEGEINYEMRAGVSNGVNYFINAYVLFFLFFSVFFFFVLHRRLDGAVF